MASKTVVCPECGSAAAPGRYACSECGALLASVALTALGRAPTRSPNGDAQTVDEAASEPAAVGAAEPALEDLGASVSTTLPPSVAENPDEPPQPREALSQPATPDPPEDLAPEESPSGQDIHPGEAAPFDENAPLEAASRFAPQPDVLHDLTAPDPLDEEPTPASGPSWPPPGDRGVLDAPEARTPAGAYLPPSAVLPPLDAPLGRTAIPAAAATGSTAIPAAGTAGASPTGPGAAVTGWASRGLTGFTDRLGPARVTTSASRRAIAMGAGLASLGLLLPWVNTLPGGNPFANYFDRWGLVGPGGWIPLVALVALLSVAAGWGRVMSWPLGLPAVAASAFLAGLLFRYVFGGFGWSIGIWFTVVGAIVLLAGGILDGRVRHEPGIEPV